MGLTPEPIWPAVRAASLRLARSRPACGRA